LVLGLLVTGERFDAKIGDKLVQMVADGILPFHATTHSKPQSCPSGDARLPFAGQFSSPDALFLPRWMAATADDPTIKIVMVIASMRDEESETFQIRYNKSKIAKVTFWFLAKCFAF
jgi:hypothetical protein